MTTVDKLYEDIEQIVDHIVGAPNLPNQFRSEWSIGMIREMVRQAYRMGLKDAEEIDTDE